MNLCKYVWILMFSLLVGAVAVASDGAELKVAEEAQQEQKQQVNTARKIELPENSGYFSFINEPPAPGFIYVTFFLAIVTFSWKMIEFIINRKDKAKEHTAGLRSEYWFKSIIMPMCATPLIDFIMQSANKLYIMSGEYEGSEESVKKQKYDAFLKEFKREKNFISSRFLLLESLGDDLYRNASETIDDLDDIVTQHCYLISTSLASTDDRQYENVTIVRQSITYKLNDILSELYNIYKN